MAERRKARRLGHGRRAGWKCLAARGRPESEDGKAPLERHGRVILGVGSEHGVTGPPGFPTCGSALAVLAIQIGEMAANTQHLGYTT